MLLAITVFQVTNQRIKCIGYIIGIYLYLCKFYNLKLEQVIKNLYTSPILIVIYVHMPVFSDNSEYRTYKFLSSIEEEAYTFPETSPAQNVK